MSKSIFLSKTFWANLLGGVATVIGEYGGFFPPGAAPILAGISAAVNIGLRFVTTQPVSISGS